MGISDAVVPMNDYAVVDTLWADWSPGFTPDPAFMRALKETFDAPGCLSAALDYYRFTFGAKESDPALEAVGAAFSRATPVPTLYLHGTDDGVMGAEMVVEDELRPFFPAGLDLVMVPGTGHFLHLEEPELVNGRIVSFLSG